MDQAGQIRTDLGRDPRGRQDLDGDSGIPTVRCQDERPLRTGVESVAHIQRSSTSWVRLPSTKAGVPRKIPWKPSKGSPMAMPLLSIRISRMVFSCVPNRFLMIEIA